MTFKPIISIDHGRLNFKQNFVIISPLVSVRRVSMPKVSRPSVTITKAPGWFGFILTIFYLRRLAL